MPGPETIRVSFSPDGTNELLGSFGVPDGEVWYVDKVRIASDGGGNDGSYSFKVYTAVINESVNPTPGDVLTIGKSSGDVKIDDIQRSQATLGQYAYPGDKVVISSLDGVSDNGTLYGTVGVRRVIP